MNPFFLQHVYRLWTIDSKFQSAEDKGAGCVGVIRSKIFLPQLSEDIPGHLDGVIL